MTRGEMLARLILGMLLMGILTLVTDIIADLIQAASSGPIKEQIKARALRAVGA